MAIAKDLPETYLCETDADRNRIDCYAGQKCIMANGDIYVCITKGVWRKIGDELCAAIYTVEGETYLSQVYIKGESINAPDDPTIPDGTFNGWKVGEDLVEFPYTLNADTTFIADITVTPPTPPTPTDLLSLEINDTNFTVIEYDDETYYINTRAENDLGLEIDKYYAIDVITTDNYTYTMGAQAYDADGIPILNFVITDSLKMPQNIKALVDQVSINDGVHFDLDAGEIGMGGYLLTLVPIGENTLTTISAIISKIVVNPAEF